jgi:hypothetical protein
MLPRLDVTRLVCCDSDFTILFLFCGELLHLERTAFCGVTICKRNSSEILVTFRFKTQTKRFSVKVKSSYKDERFIIN